MKSTITGVGVAVLAMALAVPAVASAQVQTSTETQLAQRAAQYPHEISGLLDLAKLYFEQHRYDEASRTLSRAMTVIQQEQQLVVHGATTAAAFATGEPVLRVGGDVREPKKIKDVAPIYPQVAQTAKVSGYVILEAIIGPDGHVREAKVIKSHPLLDAAAIDAVLQWEYAPPTLNGVPVAVIMSVTVIFSLK